MITAQLRQAPGFRRTTGPQAFSDRQDQGAPAGSIETLALRPFVRARRGDQHGARRCDRPPVREPHERAAGALPSLPRAQSPPRGHTAEGGGEGLPERTPRRRRSRSWRCVEAPRQELFRRLNMAPGRHRGARRDAPAAAAAAESASGAEALDATCCTCSAPGSTAASCAGAHRLAHARRSCWRS